MGKKIKFAVLGGDPRQRELVRLLAEDGHRVAPYALGLAGETGLEDCLWNAEAVILPLPAADARGMVNAPLSEKQLEIREVLERMRPWQLLCAGRAGACLKEMAAEKGIRLVDYLEREEFAVLNAAATAEGALQILMEELPITLWESKVLVIGHGRIGRVLARRLSALGARVTVAARKCADMAWIRVMGWEGLDSRTLRGHLGSFDCVVNTVPARVLEREQLSELKGGCLCLDLASKPGGLDFEAAASLGLRAIWALSLPGKAAPATAGRIIRDTIYNIVEEQEETS